MEGTIVVQEERSVVDKFKAWYKEKLIDTGNAQKIEEGIDLYTKVEKRVVQIAGTIATVVLVFCPADGPFGEICTALATPALAKLVELKGEAIKKVVIGGKRKLEGELLQVDGSSKKVTVPETDIVDIAKQVKDGVAAVEEMGRSL